MTKRHEQQRGRLILTADKNANIYLETSDGLVTITAAAKTRLTIEAPPMVKIERDKVRQRREAA